jgi:uncharacterized protein
MYSSPDDKEFYLKSKKWKIDCTDNGGTRITDDMREESEVLVSKDSMEIVSSTNRLVLADFNKMCKMWTDFEISLNSKV